MTVTQSALRLDELSRLRNLSQLLDSSIRLPGGYRIGLDGLIGLIPGIGDAIGACAGAYIVIRAAQLGASSVTLVRMIGNVIIETLLGAIPIIGDLFDFVWKANNRNVALLEKQMHRLIDEGMARRRLTTATMILLAAFLLLLAVVLVSLVSVFLRLIQVLGVG